MLKRRFAKGRRDCQSACIGKKKKSLPEASPFTVDQVREVFQRETGDELIVEDVARGVPEIGDATLLGVRPELDEKYADFGITVYVELERSKRDGFTNGRNPDENGIYWEYSPAEAEGEASYWSAGKFYGNVALTWFHPSKRTNQQWERLDAALTQLEEPD